MLKIDNTFYQAVIVKIFVDEYSSNAPALLNLANSSSKPTEPKRQSSSDTLIFFTKIELPSAAEISVPDALSSNDNSISFSNQSVTLPDASTKLEKGLRAMTMKERLAIHKQIVKENERKLKEWKERRKVA